MRKIPVLLVLWVMLWSLAALPVCGAEERSAVFVDCTDGSGAAQGAVSSWTGDALMETEGRVFFQNSEAAAVTENGMISQNSEVLTATEDGTSVWSGETLEDSGVPLDDTVLWVEGDTEAEDASVRAENAEGWENVSMSGQNGEAAQAGEAPLYDSIELPDVPGLWELETKIPQDAGWLVEEMTPTDWESLLQLTPEAFFSALWHKLQEEARRPIQIFGGLLGVLLLCGWLEATGDTVVENPLSGVFRVVSVGSTAAALASPILEAITDTQAVVEECGVFISAFIPVFASVATAGGKAASAGVYTVFVFGACQIFSRVASVVLAPLMGIFMALCLAGSVAPGIHIQPLAKMIRQGVNWTLSLMLTLFVALLSLQSMVASAGDQVLGKTAKFLVGSFVPVVGGALADAYTASQGYMHLVKSAVGVFGILAAAAAFLPVVLQSVLWYMMASAAAAIGEMLSVKPVAGLLKSAGDALGMLMAITLCFGLMFVLSTSMILLFTGGG